MNSNALTLDWEKICISLKIPFKKRCTGVIEVLCPFHLEKTPSVRMWPKSGRFHCFGCGHDGDQRQFLQEILKVPENHLDLDNIDYYKLIDVEGQMKLASIEDSNELHH